MNEIPSSRALSLPSSPLKGPRHLLEWLMAGRPPAGLHLLGLDSERRAVHRSHTGPGASLPASWEEVEEVEYWVPVAVAPDRPEAKALLELARAWRAPEGGALLDLLVTDGASWWSALCEDESCCPADGRPLERARLADELASAWRETLGGNRSGDLRGLVEGLAGIELRDALLVAIADSETRSRWRQLFPQLDNSADDCSAAARAGLLAAEATAHFLDGEFEEAREYAIRSQALVDDYSYARLLLSALDSRAPRALLFDALNAAGANLPVLATAAS